VGLVTEPEVQPASQLAAATAQVAHGSVQHGDNDPARTDQIKAQVAAVDILVPRLDPAAPGYPMCWAWAGPAQRDTAKDA
jgi:hypothetical protein